MLAIFHRGLDSTEEHCIRTALQSVSKTFREAEMEQGVESGTLLVRQTVEEKPGKAWFCTLQQTAVYFWGEDQEPLY